MKVTSIYFDFDKCKSHSIKVSDIMEEKKLNIMLKSQGFNTFIKEVYQKGYSIHAYKDIDTDKIEIDYSTHILFGSIRNKIRVSRNDLDYIGLIFDDNENSKMSFSNILDILLMSSGDAEILISYLGLKIYECEYDNCNIEMYFSDDKVVNQFITIVIEFYIDVVNENELVSC